jgi:hypothetical protein
VKYTVIVDSNHAYMDETARYTLGEFQDRERAIEVCKKLVDEFLLASWRPGISADEMFSNYMMYGDDPFIVSEELQKPFSARDYARCRSGAICAC